jgi:hypothetical protein
LYLYLLKLERDVFLCREIQELLQEKMQLEREVQDQEYNIQARKTETHSLQVGLLYIRNRSTIYRPGKQRPTASRLVY